MAKSARSSVRKTNRARLKKKVFGPVEAARTKRLSEKLAELASTPKAAAAATTTTTADMDVDTEGAPTSPPAEPESKENSGHTDDASMDVDDPGHTPASKPMSRSQEKKRKEAKAARIEKKRHRKTTNKVAFGKKPPARRGQR